jgi:hypothetical protein
VKLLSERVPNAVPLFIAASLSQLPLARALREAPAEAFEEIARALREKG